MTLPLLTILWIVILHFVGDFVLQSHWMAANKSRRMDALGAHCLIYGLVFVLPFGVLFAGVNAALHFCVDLVTSRITAALWQRQEWHWFFVVVGADQAIHYACLFGTLGPLS